MLWAFDGLGVDAFKKKTFLCYLKKGRFLHCTYHLLHFLIYQHSHCCLSHCRSPSSFQRIFSYLLTTIKISREALLLIRQVIMGSDSRRLLGVTKQPYCLVINDS